MKIIQTKLFSKIAGSWDDQPNFFMPRYQRHQDKVFYAPDSSIDSEEDIKKMWQKKQKRKKKIKSKNLI